MRNTSENIVEKQGQQEQTLDLKKLLDCSSFDDLMRYVVTEASEVLASKKFEKEQLELWLNQMLLQAEILMKKAIKDMETIM